MNRALVVSSMLVAEEARALARALLDAAERSEALTKFLQEERDGEVDDDDRKNH